MLLMMNALFGGRGRVGAVVSNLFSTIQARVPPCLRGFT